MSAFALSSAGAAGATGPTGATGSAGVDAATDGWVDDSAATWTRTANTTFTVTGDRTAVFQKGTRLRWTQTTVKYGVVVGSSHAAGTTTVTIAATPDYVLTAAAISVNSYSHTASPQGYPDWFNFTPTYTGFSADPTLSTGAIRFSIIGRTCNYNHCPDGNGTSNATGFTVTAPVAAAVRASVVQGRAINNGSALAAPSMIGLTAGSATLSLNRDGTGLSWTNSAAKNSTFTITYEF